MAGALMPGARAGDGGLLAVAASYTFEQGDRPHPADAIYVRRMADAEVLPKSRQ